ncbi:hypothetical protein JBKA6_0676 [Ichthyobacterium seriolicida]|uniref:Uncharacterized protein n=1 Tax=Ichthyobacterium seriolicida TaxID=242600 RepID=A0A1J1DXW6_9FLAO|nr:hypothetical protein JBKA6_0676 [Ichthyobacterium seriolicida]
MRSCDDNTPSVVKNYDDLIIKPEKITSGKMGVLGSEEKAGENKTNFRYFTSKKKPITL